MEQATHVAILNGERAYCTPETFQAVCDGLVAKHGGGVPEVKALEDAAAVSPQRLPPASDEGDRKTPVPMAPAESISDVGRARAQSDERMALENGFVPQQPLYSIGTRVNKMGVENARRSQLEHEAKPSSIEVCDGLIETVRAERRQDLPALRIRDLRMTSRGKVVLPGNFGGTRLPLNDKALGGLLARMPRGARKGAGYLAHGCWPELRAINFNHWALKMDSARDDTTVVLRTKQTEAGDRFAFATVSEKYAAFDADKIAQALKIAFPEDAKGSLDYDGERMRVEGIWHSDVAAEEYVAGEIFKAGVVVSTDDTGGGSVRVRSVIWRNLCLNLIILDESVGVDIKLRHLGDVDKLAAEFRAGFTEALGSVDGFRRQWGAAREERDDVLKARAQGTTEVDLGLLPIEAVLPGLFTHVVERELVPVSGKSETIVPKLMELHAADEAAADYGVSRASMVNAFTRYAHEVEVDPFKADRIREGAGKLLASRKPIGYEVPKV